MHTPAKLLLLAVFAAAGSPTFGAPAQGEQEGPRNQVAALAVCTAKIHLGQPVVAEARHVVAVRIDEYLELHGRAVEDSGIPTLIPAGPARPLTN